MKSQWTLGRVLLTLYAVAGFAYLFVPIVFTAVFSFNAPEGRFNLVWQSFTLDNWFHPFANASLTSALLYSLQIALISAAAATVLGSLIAMASSRYEFRGRSGLDLLLILPLTTPEVVMGAALAALFFDLGMGRSMLTIVLSHIMFSVSFVALTVKARLRGFDWTLEDAANDLGASPWRAFRTVTFPLILPGIVAAFLLSFALSLDDFIITFFTAGSRNTFPLQVYGGSRNGTPPQINVLAMMLLVATVGLLGLSAAWQATRTPSSD